MHYPCMEAVANLSTLYLILACAAFGAGLAGLGIALVMSRHRAWDWLYAVALRKIVRDSLKKKGSADVLPFERRR